MERDTVISITIREIELSNFEETFGIFSFLVFQISVLERKCLIDRHQFLFHK